MSSGSELTDIEDEEFSLPTKGKSKTKNKADSGYKIRGALKVPRATTYTCQSLYEQIHGQDIDLQPEYQRAVVWPDSKQIGLVDSIFRNFYVPPVIFVVNVQDEDGAERRVCVDGKQRLTSIYRFIGGEIPYRDAFTGEKFIFKDTGKIKAHILPDRYKKLFLNKQIVCMEYQDITPANEREIFQRVQLGMALTPAEKLQAISGPRADFVRELQDTYVVDKLASHITWDISRANDFRGLATAVFGISKWPHLTTMPSFSGIESWLQEPEELDEDFCEDVQNTFHIFCELAKDAQFSKPFWLAGVKKVAPMEVIAISILIHANKKNMTMSQLSEAIGLLRKDIRKTEKDVRQNTRTMKIILAFLKDLTVAQVKPDPDATTAYGQPAATKQKRKPLPQEDVQLKRKKATKFSADGDETPSPAPRTPTISQSAPPPMRVPQLPPPTSTARSAPTAPSAVRIAGADLPPRPNIPPPPNPSRVNIPPPTKFALPRPVSLGENLMARMNHGSQPPPLGSHDGRLHDPSRHPRNRQYQAADESGPSWTRR